MFQKNQTPADYEYFTIYDSKVGIYREPMLAINSQDIVRQFHDLFRDPQQTKNSLIMNAEDYAVFKIGSFNKKTGEIKTCSPEHVVNLHEIRTMVRNSEPQPIQAGH